MPNMITQLEAQFKNKRFWNYKSNAKADAKKKTYTLENIGIHPDTGSPMITYRADKSGTLYVLDANSFFGFVAGGPGKPWMTRFELCPPSFQAPEPEAIQAQEAAPGEEEHS